MSYAQVLVAMSDDEAALRRAARAGALAGQLGAGLLGVMSRWPQAPEVEPNAAIGMVGALLADRRVSCNLEIAAVEARFRAIVGCDVERVSFAGGVGSMTEAILRQSRRADLVVIGQSDLRPGDRDQLNVEAILGECGRPVLVVPAVCEAPAVPGHVAVIWRNCRASRRVLREALPLLRLAQRVSVIAMSDNADSLAADGDAADVADFLNGHSVPARAVGRTGPASLRELQHFFVEDGADLLVAPAHCSHQLVAAALVRDTRRMLTRCRIPCLLAN